MLIFWIRFYFKFVFCSVFIKITKGSQKKTLTKRWFYPNNESQWGPKQDILFVLQVCKDVRKRFWTKWVKWWWQNFHFWLNCPFKPTNRLSESNPCDILQCFVGKINTVSDSQDMVTWLSISALRNAGVLSLFQKPNIMNNNIRSLCSIKYQSKFSERFKCGLEEDIEQK